MSNAFTAEDLARFQAETLDGKYTRSQAKISEVYARYGNRALVSFSGGKDSTVLADLCGEWCSYVGMPLNLAFCNTGLEYPEIQKHVKDFAEYERKKYGIEVNLAILRPKMRFDDVISTYGYPIIGKEVAEAIYYARRIRSQTVNVERDRAQTSRTTRQKRQEFTASRVDSNVSNLGGQNHLIETSTARNRRTVLLGRMPGVNGKTGEGGAFSGDEQFSGKSLFNKQKWLPAARDLPFMISHKCCAVMKKAPLGSYQRKNKMLPVLGTLAEESRVRKQAWIRHGCNAFDSSHPTSQPLSFWKEQDILHYILKNDIPIASVYGDIVATDADGNDYIPIPGMNDDCELRCSGCDRTGCIFCGFGAHLEKGETRFQKLAKTHPRQYEYCIGGGQWEDNPAYDPTAPKMDGEWQNWNPKKIWVPSKDGLGMGKVFDMFNEIYGKDFLRYE